MFLWTNEHLHTALHIPLKQSSVAWCAQGVSVDTRTLLPGNLFIALRGTQHDGHDFLEDAFSKGAIAAVIDNNHKTAISSSSYPCIYVDNTYDALRAMAVHTRKNFTQPILGITGSVGKTTIKEGVAFLMQAQRKGFASYANYNNMLGMMLNMVNMPYDSTWAVFELGMNHPQEIADMVTILQPTMAMIHKITYQHGANFKGLPQIAEAKAEIFSHHQCGVGLYHHHEQFRHILQERGKNVHTWITFCDIIGCTCDADVGILEVHNEGVWCGVTIRYGIHSHTYHLPHIGDYWRFNSVVLLTCVGALQGCVDTACGHIKNFSPPAGRGKVHSIGAIHIIDHSYNAAFDAMLAALESFKHFSATGKKYLILGDMAEQGEQASTYHMALADPIKAVNPEKIWLCGAYMSLLIEKLAPTYDVSHGLTIENLIPEILETLLPGDAVLIKGSHGQKIFLFLEAIKVRYGDEVKK